MPRTLALGLLTLALFGCATGPSLEPERTYRVESIGEIPLPADSHLTLTLGEDGRAYGNAGCNHWFAPYRLDGERLSFGAIGSTRMLCVPTQMDQETRFLKALEQVQRWDLSPQEQLRLWPAVGQPLQLSPEQG